MSDSERKGVYKTKQKSAILEFLKHHSEELLTPETIWDQLSHQGIRVSLVTVYRFLDTLTESGEVLKLNSTDGKRSLFKYAASDEKDFSHGRMICLRCGKLLPLECSLLETFYEHVQAEHGCRLDYGKTVLYCLCPYCISRGESL